MNDFLANVTGWLPLIAFVIPIITGLIYRSTIADKFKTVILLVVTSVATFVNEIIAGSVVLDETTFYAWLATLVIAVASYYGVWKPIGLGNIAPDKGIGPSEDK